MASFGSLCSAQFAFLGSGFLFPACLLQTAPLQCCHQTDAFEPDYLVIFGCSGVVQQLG